MKPYRLDRIISAPIESQSHANRWSDVNLFAVALIWGINMAVMKFAITEIDRFAFNAIRLALSAGVLGICVWLENRTSHRQVSNPPSKRKYWMTVGMFALLSGAFYQVLFVVGMDQTTAGNTALIMSSMPMWTAVLSFVIFKERLKWAWLGITITFLGTLVVTLQKSGFSLESEYLMGNLIILFSALAWALGSVVSRPILSYVSPIRLAFFATAGTLPLHILLPFLVDVKTEYDLFETKVVIAILYSGIFSTGFAYAMWNLGVKQLGASHAAVYQNLVPLVALIVSWWFLHESITSGQIVGGAMIIAGLFIARRLRPKRR